MIDKSKGWVAVDLDGTLAKWVKWSGPSKIGEPVPSMVKRVRDLLAQGYEVRIFTARMSGPMDEQQQVQEAVQRWTKKHVGTPLKATCKKDYAMIALYDDLAVGVEQNTGKLLGPEPTHFTVMPELIKS